MVQRGKDRLERPKHGFADETYTIWCFCGEGFNSWDQFDDHEKKEKA